MENYRELKLDFNRVGTVMLMMLAAQNLLRIPVWTLKNAGIVDAASDPLAAALINMVVYAGVMAATLGFASCIFENGTSFLYPVKATRPDYLLPAVGTGLGACMVSNLAATVALLLLQLLGVHSAVYTPNFGGGWLAGTITFVSMTVLPAIFEELIFRGALLQPLRKYGDRLALVVSAVLFAACHSTLPQMLNAFVVGLCLGVFAIRSGSLVTGMIVHFLYNSMACALTILNSRLPQNDAAALGWMLILGAVLLGGICIQLLRRRFGRVWWVPGDPFCRLPEKHAAKAFFSCAPLMLAIALFVLFMLPSISLGGAA